MANSSDWTGQVLFEVARVYITMPACQFADPT
jgi:hypothetical protein